MSQYNDSGGTLVGASYKEIGSLSANADNGLVVPATDVSFYKWFSLQLTGSWTATVNFEGSNDNTTWYGIDVVNTVSSSTPVGTATANGIYAGPINFRYLRARLHPFSAGPVTGVLELYTMAPAPQSVVVLDSPNVSENIAQFGGTNVTIGQQNMANSMPVAIASNQSAVPVSGTVTATNPSVGTDGSAIPASSTLVGASDGTNLQQLLVESSSNRNLRVGIYSGANEASVSAGGAVKVDNSAVTQPVSGTVTANVGTNFSDTFGSATTITAATTFSGVPTVSQLAANSSANITNNGSQATFIVEVNVASAFTGTLSFYGLEPDGTTLQAINAHQRGSSTNATSTALAAASATNQTWEGSAASLKAIYVVCTAFTSGSVSVQLGLTAAPYAFALINTGSVNLTQVAGSAVALGQTTKSASLPVTVASDQGSIGSVTANAGTNLNTSALALETGGNLANAATVLGATSDAAVTGDNNGTLKAAIRGIGKILNDIWDSTNHLFHFNLKQVGGSAVSLGQAAMSASVPVAVASNQGNIPVQLVDTGGTNKAGIDSSNNLQAKLPSNNRSDTYTTTGAGTAVNMTTAGGVKHFSIQVVQTGTVTSWTVTLDGSNDGVNWTTIITHQNTDTSGKVKTASNQPCLYFRSNCSALTLGAGTNVVAYILGMN